MKYCKNCGKEIKDGAVVCVHCGCALKLEKKFVPKNYSVGAIVLGILAIIFCATPVVGLTLGIIALILGIKEKGAGLALGIIGFVFSLLCTLFYGIIIFTSIALISDYDDPIEEFESFDFEHILDQETKDVFAGNEFKADDESIIYFDENGNFSWLADSLDEYDNFYYGEYEVYNNYDALDYLEEELEEYGIEKKEILGVISRNSKYTLDNFYVIRLRRTYAIIDGEDDEEVRNAYYYGFYDEESECYDSANMNTANYVLFCKE